MANIAAEEKTKKRDSKTKVKKSKSKDGVSY